MRIQKPAWDDKQQSHSQLDRRIDELVKRHLGDSYRSPPVDRRGEWRLRIIMRDLWKNDGAQRVLDVFTVLEFILAIGKKPESQWFRDVLASIADTIAQERADVLGKEEVESLKLIAQRWWDEKYKPGEKGYEMDVGVLLAAIKKVKA